MKCDIDTNIFTRGEGFTSTLRYMVVLGETPLVTSSCQFPFLTQVRCRAIRDFLTTHHGHPPSPNTTEDRQREGQDEDDGAGDEEDRCELEWIFIGAQDHGTPRDRTLGMLENPFTVQFTTIASLEWGTCPKYGPPAVGKPTSLQQILSVVWRISEGHPLVVLASGPPQRVARSRDSIQRPCVRMPLTPVGEA